MATEPYRTRRLVLRETEGAQRIHALADKRGWTFAKEIPPDVTGEVSHELVWSAGPELSLHHFDDRVSRHRCLVVAGTDPARAEELAADLERTLDTWRLDELRAAVDVATDPEDRAQAVIRAGLGAPHEFDQALFDRVLAAIRDADARVREAGLWATAYEPWDEYYPVLRERAVHDPDEELRADAHDLLVAFELEKGIDPW